MGELRKRVAELEATSVASAAVVEASAQEAGGDTVASEASADKLVALLKELAAIPVDIAMLRRTGAGKDANRRCLRKHADKAVQQASAELVHKWMDAVGVRETGEKRKETDEPATAKAKAKSKAKKVAKVDEGEGKIK